MWKIILALLLFTHGAKAAVEHFFPISEQEARRAITELSPIGSLEAYENAKIITGLQKYFDAYGDCVVFFDWFGKGGRSLSYMYDGKNTYYRATIIFTLKPREGGVEIGVIMDNLSVEAGREFNIHSNLMPSVNCMWIPLV